MCYLFLTTTVVENSDFLNFCGWNINKSDLFLLILSTIIAGVGGLLGFIYRKVIVKTITKMMHNPKQPMKLQKNSDYANVSSSDVIMSDSIFNLTYNVYNDVNKQPIELQKNSNCANVSSSSGVTTPDKVTNATNNVNNDLHKQPTELQKNSNCANAPSSDVAMPDAVINAICNLYNNVRTVYEDVYCAMLMYLWCEFFNREVSDLVRGDRMIANFIPTYIKTNKHLPNNIFGLINETIFYLLEQEKPICKDAPGLRSTIQDDNVSGQFIDALNRKFKHLKFPYRIKNNRVVKLKPKSPNA